MDREPARRHQPTTGGNQVDANLVFANLVYGNLVNGNLVNGNLVFGNVVDNNLVNGNLVNGNLVFGNLVYGNLVNGNLVHANEVDGNLVFANIIDGNLVNANIVDGNLVNGNLVHGNLVDGNLVHGNLVHGNLVMANLVNGNELAGETVDMTLVDADRMDVEGAHAIYVPGFDPPYVIFYGEYETGVLRPLIEKTVRCRLGVHEGVPEYMDVYVDGAFVERFHGTWHIDSWQHMNNVERAESLAACLGIHANSVVQYADFTQAHKDSLDGSAYLATLAREVDYDAGWRIPEIAVAFDAETNKFHWFPRQDPELRSVGWIAGNRHFYRSLAYLAEARSHYGRRFRTCANHYLYPEDRNGDGVVDIGDVDPACAPERSIVSDAPVTRRGTYESRFAAPGTHGGYHCEDDGLAVDQANPEEDGSRADPVNELLGARCWSEPAEIVGGELVFSGRLYPAVFHSTVSIGSDPSTGLRDAYEQAIADAPPDECELDGTCDEIADAGPVDAGGPADAGPPDAGPDAMPEPWYEDAGSWSEPDAMPEPWYEDAGSWSEPDAMPEPWYEDAGSWSEPDAGPEPWWCDAGC